MKTKSIFIIILILSGSLAVTAQKPTHHAGLKAGIAIPNLTSGSNTTPLSENYKSILGLYSGLVFEYRTNHILGLRMELNYSGQGGKRTGMQALPLPEDMKPLWQMLTQIGIIHDDYVYANIESKAKLNYIELPVLARITLGIGRRANLYVNAGPYLGFLVNARNITRGFSKFYVFREGLSVDDILHDAGMPLIGTVSFDSDVNITSDTRRLNVGGQGIAGFEYMIPSGKLFIEGGGNYGFIPVQKDPANGLNHTGAATVTVGYLHQLFF